MSGDFLDTAEHADHFPDTMDVQVLGAGGEPNARGVKAPGSWATVTGKGAVRCLKYSTTQPQEYSVIEGGKQESFMSTHEIITQDYDPAITVAMRGVIDGETYRFLFCDHEGMKTVGIIKARRLD